VKVPLELHYIAAWVVFFALNTVAIRYLFIAGTVASSRFPDSPWMRHLCILSGIALSLVVSYFLFRTIVKYLVRRS
jgi:hypothetical protein